MLGDLWATKVGWCRHFVGCKTLHWRNPSLAQLAATVLSHHMNGGPSAGYPSRSCLNQTQFASYSPGSPGGGLWWGVPQS